MEDDFEDWFLQNDGFIHSSVEIAWDETYGQHMRVEQGDELAADSLVVSCPHSLTISWLNVIQGRESFLSQFDLEEEYYSVNQVVIVRFFLLNEFLKREKSFWYPYLRSLPQPTDPHFPHTPLWYDVGDWAWIRGTDLERTALKTEEAWGQEYEHTMASLTPAAKASTKDWSWTLYKWAATIMSSRSFPSSALANSALTQTVRGDAPQQMKEPDETIEPGSPVLVPGVDILNHRIFAKVTWQWGSLSCRIVTNETIPSGLQVFNNYGPKSNTELIMGYGFSLANNPAEHCVFALAPQYAAKPDILEPETVDVQQRGHESTPKRISHRKERLDVVHWIRLRNDVLDQERKAQSLSFVCSPGLLHDTAIALSNKRERAIRDSGLLNQVDFSILDLSRNKLKVMCVLAMLVQRRHAAITQHDLDLPESPANPKQYHADRYRRDQIHILKSVNDELLDKLAGLAGLKSTSARDYRVIRMEHMLTESPKPVLTDYRAALHAGLGTRNAAKLRERGWTECAFAIWLWGIWLWGIAASEKVETSGSSSLHDAILQWLKFLTNTYGDLLQTQGINGKRKRSWQLAHMQLTEDDLLLVDSFLNVVTAAVKKNPKSIYNSLVCTKERLLWCLHVVREESVMAPNLEGKLGDDNDELLLFLDRVHEEAGGA